MSSRKIRCDQPRQAKAVGADVRMVYSPMDACSLANEGKVVLVVPEAQAEAALAAMRSHPAGRDAAVIGRAGAGPEGRVVMNTVFGGRRVVDMLAGEQLPRVC